MSRTTRYKSILDDDDDDNYKSGNNGNKMRELFGDWTPDELSNELSLDNLEKEWINEFSNQIDDLESLLDNDTKIITKNYINKKVTLVHGESGTFTIEMLRKLEGSDLLENNIYVRGNDIPIYTENVNDTLGEVLGNFWMSFLEYGLVQYLSILK